jgi:aryl sulfotransferase
VIDWLASYPKSGNTWMRMMLANYFSETDEQHDINKPGVTNGIASSRTRFDEFLGVSSADLTPSEVRMLQPEVYRQIALRVRERVWLKVHDAQARLDDCGFLFPPDISSAVVYLVRHPLDVAVSLAFHDGHEDMARSVAFMCNPEASLSGPKSLQLYQRLGNWGQHVQSWVDQHEIPVLVVRYEDMLADPGNALQRVLAFARPDITIDPARVDLAVEHAAFGALQAAESARPFRETPAKAKRFFRSGKAGEWRKHLSTAQVRQMIDCHGAMMARFAYAE